MTSSPTVTIGLPFRDSAVTLADTIRSVFGQTCSDWELILVDDGSTDASAEIALAVRDSRVTVVRSRKSLGLATRLNQIAQLARARFLARVDADDLMHPERLEHQLRHLEQREELDLVGSAMYSLTPDNRVVGVRGEAPVDSSPRSVLRHGLLAHPTVVGRTLWFRENPYDVELQRSQDRELWCRTLGSSTCSNLAAPLHFYREGPVDVRKYALGQKVNRSLLRRYGPTAIGRVATAGLIAESHAKSWIYRVAGALGRQNRLVRRRNRPLSNDQCEAAELVVQRILGTPVPGLADPNRTSPPPLASTTD